MQDIFEPSKIYVEEAEELADLNEVEGVKLVTGVSRGAGACGSTAQMSMEATNGFRRNGRLPPPVRAKKLLQQCGLSARTESL